MVPTADIILSTVISVVVLLFSLSFHECAHGWVAHKLGDNTAWDSGRITLNPLAHLDPLGTLMMLGGLVGWAKPVPINPTRFNPRISMKKGMVLTAVAGPLSNLFLSFIANILLNIVLLLAAVSAAKTTVSLYDSHILKIILEILIKFSILNINLAIFNVLPVPPLDGYKVFGAVLPNKLYYSIMRYERYIGLAFIAVILFLPSVLNSVLHVVATPFELIIHRPIDLLFRFLGEILI
ncbi:peptidase, M50 family [Mageeibacillus indolicus UPII9-5]|uniref:Peptidase, M50 family n=1 Tax=Mageeibacillus indolicus (strain UPII9-5) TaxID=699246 RepID=D3R2D7_MAGIU|nr:site-2 protease family protein [Mageeibacillus indolicus]ADC90603.1 peptidase, M50 family [Mageeibacillus indolicus UPII9-5]